MGKIEILKNIIVVALKVNKYRDIWISEDYLFNVLKENYRYVGEKSLMKRAMTALKDQNPYHYNINERSISNKRITFYYVSSNGVIPDTSSISHSDWESIHL